jgi:hypothetical protein
LDQLDIEERILLSYSIYIVCQLTLERKHWMNLTQNDGITIETRLVGGVVILVLLLAFLALYIFPEHTDLDFAWTITPSTSAILIGAGYTAGAYFFARVVTEKKWHRVQVGFLPITAFTIFMLAATLLHWSRFHHGSLPFYAWTGIYAITPFLVPFLWWRNRAKASPELEEKDIRFSTLARWILGSLAVTGALIAVLVFLLPAIAIAISPWKLTELTARIISGWSMLSTMTILMIAIDGRWSATRIMLQSAVIGTGLVLLAIPRMWSDFDPARPMTYVFVAGVVLGLLALIGIHIWLERQSQNR